MHDAQVEQERQAANKAGRPKHGGRRYQPFRGAGQRAESEPERGGVYDRWSAQHAAHVWRFDGE